MKGNNTYQSELNFDATTLRDTGIQMAADHADSIINSWSDNTYRLFKEWLKGQKGTFLGEHFREWAEKQGNPIPPSNRAYGSILVRAAKEKLIMNVGFDKTSNPKAHKTPSTLWIKR